MKYFRRVGVFIILVSLLTTAGFGCKGLSSEQRQAIAPISLEYWTVFDDVDALQKLITKFTASRPYLSISIRQLREDELYSRLIEALADDKGPDIISIPNRQMALYLPKLAAMPTGIKDTTVQVIKGKLGTETKVNITNQTLPTALQIGNDFVQVVKKDVVYQDKIYGLPMSLDTMALYYNKDLLDRAGIPQPPKDWTEFASAVRKLSKYDKNGKVIQSGTALGTGNNIVGFDDLLYLLFEQSRVSFVDKNSYAVFNLLAQGSSGVSPAAAVVDFFTDFANPSKDVYSWDTTMNNSLDEFVSGKLAFFFGYSYHNSLIKSRAPQLNIEIIPMLQLSKENQVNAANYWVQTVVGKSKHQNEAWGLVSYLTYSKATKDYLDATSRPTALRAYIADQKNNTTLAPFASQVLVADNWYRGRDYKTAQSALSSMLTEWLLSGSSDEGYRQGILNRAAAKINQTL